MKNVSAHPAKILAFLVCMVPLAASAVYFDSDVEALERNGYEEVGELKIIGYYDKWGDKVEGGCPQDGEIVFEDGTRVTCSMSQPISESSARVMKRGSNYRVLTDSEEFDGHE